MKASLVTAASVLVLAVLAWLLLGRGEARSGPAEAAVVETGTVSGQNPPPLHLPALCGTQRLGGGVAADSVLTPYRAATAQPTPEAADAPAFVLHGRVHDEAGAGHEDAQVFALLADRAPRSTSSGHDGAYRIELTEDEAHALRGVAARHPRALSAGQDLVLRQPALPERHELECDLELAVACTLAVTVVDDDGEPVEGAVVRVSDTAQNWGGKSAVSREEWERQALWRLRSGTRIALAETGADGQCRLDDAPCEPRIVGAWHPRYVPRVGVPTRELDVLGRDAVRLVLERSDGIEGIVRDEAGRPVPDALVLLGRSHSAGEARSDAEGRFRVHGIPREDTTLTLLCQAEGFEPLFVERWTRPEDGPAVLTLTPGSRLELFLTDADTGLVVEGRVALRFALAGRSARIVEALARDVTSVEGRVVLEATPAFVDGLELEVEGYDPSYVSFVPDPPEGTVRLRLTRPVVCRFRAVDDVTGEPIAAWQAAYSFQRDRRNGRSTGFWTPFLSEHTSDGLVLFLPSSFVPDHVRGTLVAEAEGYEPLHVEGDRATLALGDTTVLRLHPLER